MSLFSLIFLTSCATPAINDVSSSFEDESSTLPSFDSVSNDVSIQELWKDDVISTAEFDEYYTKIKDRCVKFDINDDGVDELILLSGEQLVGDFQIISSIFSTENSMVTRRYHDDVEMGRGSFISENNRLIDYYFTNGTFYFDSYTNWKYDKDWKTEEISSLSIFYIYSLNELGDDWMKENPELSKEGVYRFITRYEKNADGELIEKKEEISQEKFEKEFEELMGVPFSQMPPEWYEYSQMKYDEENARWY